MFCFLFLWFVVCSFYLFCFLFFCFFYRKSIYLHSSFGVLDFSFSLLTCSRNLSEEIMALSWNSLCLVLLCAKPLVRTIWASFSTGLGVYAVYSSFVFRLFNFCRLICIFIIISLLCLHLTVNIF